MEPSFDGTSPVLDPVRLGIRGMITLFEAELLPLFNELMLSFWMPSVEQVMLLPLAPPDANKDLVEECVWGLESGDGEMKFRVPSFIRDASVFRGKHLEGREERHFLYGGFEACYAWTCCYGRTILWMNGGGNCGQSWRG